MMTHSVIEQGVSFRFPVEAETSNG